MIQNEIKTEMIENIKYEYKLRSNARIRVRSHYFEMTGTYMYVYYFTHKGKEISIEGSEQHPLMIKSLRNMKLKSIL